MEKLKSIQIVLEVLQMQEKFVNGLAFQKQKLNIKKIFYLIVFYQI